MEDVNPPAQGPQRGMWQSMQQRSHAILMESWEPPSFRQPGETTTGPTAVTAQIFRGGCRFVQLLKADQLPRCLVSAPSPHDKRKCHKRTVSASQLGDCSRCIAQYTEPPGLAAPNHRRRSQVGATLPWSRPKPSTHKAPEGALVRA